MIRLFVTALTLIFIASCAHETLPPKRSIGLLIPFDPDANYTEEEANEIARSKSAMGAKPFLMSLAFSRRPTSMQQYVNAVPFIFKGTVLERALNHEGSILQPPGCYVRFIVEKAFKGEPLPIEWVFAVRPDYPKVDRSDITNCTYEVGKTYLIFARRVGISIDGVRTLKTSVNNGEVYRYNRPGLDNYVVEEYLYPNQEYPAAIEIEKEIIRVMESDNENDS